MNTTKIKTLNYPLPPQIEVRRYPWLHHGKRVQIVEGNYGPTSEADNYTIWDPDNNLANMSSDMDSENYKYKVVYLISYYNPNSLHQQCVYLKEIMPINALEWIPASGQFQCGRCGYRSETQQAREVWDYTSMGEQFGRCFSCGLHDAGGEIESCTRHCCMEYESL